MTQSTSNATAGGFSEDQIQLRLDGLQYEVEKSASLVRRLRLLAIILIILLVVLLVSIHLYHVMQYARLGSVEAPAVADHPGDAEILYSPDSAGKIEFVRESEGLVQTLTEYTNAPTSGEKPQRTFTWSGKDDERSKLQITYRGGLFLVTKELSVAAPVGSK